MATIALPKVTGSAGKNWPVSSALLPAPAAVPSSMGRARIDATPAQPWWTPPISPTPATPAPVDPWPGAQMPVIGSAEDILKGLLGGDGTKTKPGSAANPYAGKTPRDIFNTLSKTLAPTSASLDTIMDAWKQAGHTVSRATHAGGQPSDDKLILDGQMIDLISNVGGPGASWTWLDVGAGGGESSGGDVSGLLASLLGTSFSDPDTANLLAFINSRLPGLTGPLPDGGFSQFQSQAQAQANSLSQPFVNPNEAETVATLKAILEQVKGPAFTSDQWAALRAQGNDQLATSRDQDIRTTLARMAALGHGKGSGTIAEALRNVETGYQSNRAAEDRQLQIAAINQDNQNRQTATSVSNLLRQIPLENQQFQDTRGTQAVNILNAILQAEASRRAEQENRLSTATTLMGVPVQLGDQRLQQALQVLGLTGNSMDPASLLQTLSSLANSARSTSLLEQQKSAALWEQVGSSIAG